MPLINFKTNLTSLKYGSDEPGGGDSGLPFIQLPIPGPDTPPKVKELYTLNQTSLDFPIRGGTITSAPNGSYLTTQGIFDEKRISAFLKSAPRGTAFIQKQVGLQLTNPRLQVQNLINLTSLTINSKTIQNIGVANGIILPVTNAYDPKNTLAQVAVMGTGAHFNRQGLAPTIYESLQDTYQYIAGAPQNNTEFTNRLSVLRILKLFPNSNYLLNSNNINNIGVDPDLVDRLGISTIQDQLFNYQGGPGSVYGIGSTIIGRAQNPDGSAVNTGATDTVIPGFYVNNQAEAYSAIGFTYTQIAQQTTRVGSDILFKGVKSKVENQDGLTPAQARIQDFRAQLLSSTNGNKPIVPFSDYTVYNIAKRGGSGARGAGGIGAGNPGEPFNAVPDRYDNKNLKFNGADLVNLNPMMYYNLLASTATTTTAAIAAQNPWNLTSDTADIIKFGFECIDNDDPSKAIALIFRAFLDGQITDSHSGEYNNFKYLGRGETFRTYQGFDRTVGFSFKVYMQSRQEMQPLYTKLNNLISQVYPDYSATSNLMRGNVVKLTIGDYLYRVPGFLESINVTIDNGNTPWEIVLGGESESDVAQLPHMVTVQCSFKPIMDILPRKAKKSDLFVPLIANGREGRMINNPISDYTTTSNNAASPNSSTTNNGV